MAGASWKLRLSLVLSALWLLVALDASRYQYRWGIQFVLIGVSPLAVLWGLYWVITGIKEQRKHKPDLGSGHSNTAADQIVGYIAKRAISRRLKMVFIWSFLVSYISLIADFVIDKANALPSNSFTPIDAVLFTLMIVSGLVWYISLGRIANQLGRSPIVWVGLTMITAPIGPLVAFPVMLSHIKWDAQPPPV